MCYPDGLDFPWFSYCIAKRVALQGVLLKQDLSRSVLAKSRIRCSSCAPIVNIFMIFSHNNPHLWVQTTFVSHWFYSVTCNQMDKWFTHQTTSLAGNNHPDLPHYYTTLGIQIRTRPDLDSVFMLK